MLSPATCTSRSSPGNPMHSFPDDDPLELMAALPLDHGPLSFLTLASVTHMAGSPQCGSSWESAHAILSPIPSRAGAGIADTEGEKHRAEFTYSMAGATRISLWSLRSLVGSFGAERCADGEQQACRCRVERSLGGNVAWIRDCQVPRRPPGLTCSPRSCSRSCVRCQ